MNIENLRDQLIEALNDLKAGKLKTKDAKEITNLSGKIIMSAKVQLDYNKMMNNGKKIDFLEAE